MNIVAQKADSAGRHLLDHQAPDQHHHRQQVVQAGLQRRRGLGQLEDRRVRVVQRQHRLARADPHQADVGRQQPRPTIPDRAPPAARLDPADAVVHDAGQHHKTATVMPKDSSRCIAVACCAAAGPQPGLQRLQVHDVEERDVADDRRQEGVLDDLDVGDAHVLDHQEGRRAHHRRHDLAVDRAGDLHRAGLVGRGSPRASSAGS
jgi:hypothetical protein